VTRELLAAGHDVRQVPPVYAKFSQQSHKHDLEWWGVNFIYTAQTL